MTLNVYSTKGVGSPAFPEIRPLNENDWGEIALMADNAAVEECESTECIAHFLEHPGEDVELYGFFAPSLYGAVAVMLRESGEYELIAIYVAEEFRRRGIASKLVRTALALHPGAEYRVMIEPENEAAQKLAGSIGFAPCGTVSYDIP